MTEQAGDALAELGQAIVFDFPAIPIAPLTGDEPFTDTESDAPLPITVLDYWRWAASDLIGNVNRGILAEYLVAAAIGATREPRDPWAPFDLVDPQGVTIEVKSAAYVQAWGQRNQASLSFLVKPTRTMTGDPVLDATPGRRSQVWVFAVLHHKEQATINPLDLTQWEFYVLPTWFLDRRTRSQHSIALNSIKECEFGRAYTFGALAAAITAVAAIVSPPLDASAAEPLLSEPVEAAGAAALE